MEKHTINYILKNGEPVIEPDFLVWVEWSKNHNNQHVAFTKLSGAEISTVFLRMGYSFGGNAPALYETMIFGGEHDNYQERYCTLEEAIAGHEKAVAPTKLEIA